jgi:uncharacterized protein
MLTKLPETKVLRDPVHNYIQIDYAVVWDVLATREVQRLRRIHQLGTTYLVYHGAEHSRFSHSLGVYEIARRMMNEVSGIETLSERDRVGVMLAALLHDIGHGPYSHIFERITGVAHETITLAILRSNSEVHRVLETHEPGLSAVVASIIDHSHPDPLLSSFVSGQLDADRMDYLLRDAYFTGTSYGRYDLERILRTLTITQRQLTVKESGIHSVEDYIMARYQMYWQVYYHPVSRAVEGLLNGFFTRLNDLQAKDESWITRYPLLRFLRDVSDLDAFAHLDESTVTAAFHQAALDGDPILADLSRRLLNRDLFGYTDAQPDKLLNLTQAVTQHYDARYYLYVDKTTNQPYTPYTHGGSPILITRYDGQVAELSTVSHIVAALVSAQTKVDPKIFVPKELL